VAVIIGEIMTVEIKSGVAADEEGEVLGSPCWRRYISGRRHTSALSMVTSNDRTVEACVIQQFSTQAVLVLR